MDELIEQAKTIVNVIRSQNWKNGGVMTVDDDAAIAAVIQLVKTAYSQGRVDATDHTSKMMLRTFDAVLGNH